MIVCAFYTNRTTSALRFIMLRKLSPTALKADMKISCIINWVFFDLIRTPNIMKDILGLGIKNGILTNLLVKILHCKRYITGIL